MIYSQKEICIYEKCSTSGLFKSPLHSVESSLKNSASIFSEPKDQEKGSAAVFHSLLKKVTSWGFDSSVSSAMNEISILLGRDRNFLKASICAIMGSFLKYLLTCCKNKMETLFLQRVLMMDHVERWELIVQLWKLKSF